jgi:ribosomal protein S18 acetylase RimI-like enzyme
MGESCATSTLDPSRYRVKQQATTKGQHHVMIDLAPRIPWKLLIFVKLLLHCCSSGSGAWYIAPPRANTEWQQLSQLVVETFDAPDQQQASAMEWGMWNLVQKRQCTRQTYEQYTRTARKMRRMKHTILLAKDQGLVIGMVEMGISSVAAAVGGNSTDSTTAVAAAELRRPTIGVLCVAARYRQQGVAKDLVDRCIQIASNQEYWGGDYHDIYAEVEPDNGPALAFFSSQGFVPERSGLLQNVTVRRRNRVETRPHLLLSRPLNIEVRR